jgi:hypothetical protein
MIKYLVTYLLMTSRLENLDTTIVTVMPVKRPRTLGCSFLLVLVVGWLPSGWLLGQSNVSGRPTAPKLLPDNTLLYVRVDDSRELKEKLALTATGKLSSDPQVAPIIDEFYRSFNEGMVDIQRTFGIDLDEILRIPNGEMAFALIPGAERPILVALIEAGDEMPALELILARAEESVERRGGFRDSSEVGGIEVIRWLSENRPDRQFGYFIDRGVLVLCSDPAETEDFAKVWTGNGVDHHPLSDNRRFTSILSRCVGSAGERPQVSFYADPLEVVKQLNKNNPAALAILPLLSGLGLDGIQGIGGSVILAPEGFDSLVHAHLLLENPRRGLLEVLRPKSGDTTPPAWVAEDVASYFTANWKIDSTVKAVREIFETFRGPDSFDEQVLGQAKRGLGIDLETEFLKEWSDRVTATQVVLKPARLNAVSRVFGFRMRQARTFESTTLPKMFEHLRKADGQWTTVNFGATTIYTRPGKPGSETSRVRRPEPAMTVLGDDFLVADSLQAIQACIESFQNGEGCLSDALEYKLVRDQVKKQLGDAQASVVAYQRPEESLKMLYDLIADPATIDRVREAKDNPMAKALLDALDRHRLPPFEAIAKYLSPMGAYLTEEENGLHYTGFSMRR